MEKVYVVLVNTRYEGDALQEVFKTKSDAERFCKNVKDCLQSDQSLEIVEKEITTYP